MHSRVRTVIEGLLRTLAFAALIGLVVHAFRALRVAPPAVATGARVDSALVDWSTRAAPARVHVRLEKPATPQVRDWLAALAHAGSNVTWSGAAPVMSALAVEPVADP